MWASPLFLYPPLQSPFVATLPVVSVVTRASICVSELRGKNMAYSKFAHVVAAGGARESSGVPALSCRAVGLSLSSGAFRSPVQREHAAGLGCDRLNRLPPQQCRDDLRAAPHPWSTGPHDQPALPGRRRLRHRRHGQLLPPPPSLKAEIQYRRRRRQGLQDPLGGLFELVACPHYLFEIVVFLRFAMIAQTVFALAVAISTTVYLAGRSCATRRWYASKFEEFLIRIRALVPYVL
ncbi:hypothetical protein PR202_gb12330 [Eleusine coracana subsp. coracana]|uniref:3-oxo-5-alpha-steroid 4-dehydrogenase C-terminal domain-containing protein n=1 Tax=Eleusine coracana subsp. coracana TaxID=191504 RepID=A0AAV5EQQ7_ELECO|nr:hypothetical protein PR202_gb12330 [Eleusine coracana subsp. coracana]